MQAEVAHPVVAVKCVAGLVEMVRLSVRGLRRVNLDLQHDYKAPTAMQLAQLYHPQLVRTLTVARVDDFVSRGDVHEHLKIALEGTNRPIHLCCTSFNVHRHELA